MENPKKITDSEFLIRELKNPVKIEILDRQIKEFATYDLPLITYNIKISKRIFFPCYQTGGIKYILN